MPSRAFVPNSAIFASIAANGHGLDVSQDRHHEPARRADRDSDVAVVVVDDLAVLDAGVDGGEALKRLHRRLGEERHEAEAHPVPALEALLVPGAQRDHRLHVDLVEGGQDRSGVLRLHQALRDPPAQPRHRLAVFAAGAGRRCGGRGAGRSRHGC